MTLTSEEVKLLRKLFRLTQAELGAMCDVSDAYINQIERNKRRVTPRIRASIVDKLNLTPEKLARLKEVYAETSLIV